MNGIITLKIASGFVHHAWMPCGSRAVIEAKIISEMPLPMPALGDQLAQPHDKHAAGR